MAPTDAADFLERLAVGEEGDARRRAVAMILTDSNVAADVLRHARAQAAMNLAQAEQMVKTAQAGITWVEEAARALRLP